MHSLFEGLGELCDGFRLVSGWLVHRLEVEFHICKGSKNWKNEGDSCEKSVEGYVF